MTQRHSPLHTVGFLGFCVSTWAYAHASVFSPRLASALPVAVIERAAYTLLVTIILAFLYLELWAHDEDHAYNRTMVAAPP